MPRDDAGRTVRRSQQRPAPVRQKVRRLLMSGMSTARVCKVMGWDRHRVAELARERMYRLPLNNRSLEAQRAVRRAAVEFPWSVRELSRMFRLAPRIIVEYLACPPGPSPSTTARSARYRFRPASSSRGSTTPSLSGEAGSTAPTTGSRGGRSSRPSAALPSSSRSSGPAGSGTTSSASSTGSPPARSPSS